MTISSGGTVERAYALADELRHRITAHTDSLSPEDAAAVSTMALALALAEIIRAAGVESGRTTWTRDALAAWCRKVPFESAATLVLAARCACGRPLGEPDALGRCSVCAHGLP